MRLNGRFERVRHDSADGVENMSCDQMGTFTKGLVSIIIPTLTRRKTESLQTLLRRRFLLQDCLAELRKNVRAPHETVVVCNSFNDRDLVRFVTSSGDIDKFCLNSANVGVPRSWNIGADLAQGEFLCFVNDDVEIGPGAIETMRDLLISDDAVGEVGPAGGKWWRQISGRRVGIKEIEEADEISGWLFMVKRKVFDEVGGFDPAYTPALCEEIDLSFAIRAAGYKCMVIPGLRATHHHISGASSTTRPLCAFDMCCDREQLTGRNRRYFEAKWSSFWSCGQKEESDEFS